MKTLLIALLASVRLTFGGLGDIRIGMSADALERIADVRRPDLESESAPCRYVLFEGATVGVRIARSRVAAIELADPRHRTWSGLAPGSSVRDVAAVYGKRATTRDGRRFVVRSNDRTRALVIDTDGRVVTRLTAGLPHVVERAAPCL